MFQEGLKTGTSRRVSVIIPAFNAQRYLPMTLASARAQTYTNLEIIVVDDGSTDATPEIAEAVAQVDQRVRVVHQQNAGVAAARNRGIAEAHGDYLAPLDADDIWHPQNIALQVGALEAAGPDAALSYAWFVSIDEHGRHRGTGPHNRLCASHQVLLSLMAGNFIGNGSSVVTRRSSVESVGGYDPSLRARSGEGFEDHALYLALAERWNFAVVPQYLIAYRRHAAAMSRDNQRMARSGALVLADLCMRRPDLRGYRLGRCHAVYYRELMAAAVRNGEWSKLPDVLSCATREGGAWCVLDLICHRVPERLVDHWLYRLRDHEHRAKAIQPPAEIFWPMENGVSASLPEGHMEEAQSTAPAMELKSVI